LPLTRAQAPEVEISVTVMTSTFWPMAHTAAPYALPAALTRAASAFESFYLARHTGRRLTWQPALGHADVRVQFRARAHDLNVATYALVVLLLFQDLADDEFLTYEVRTGVPS
jgi:cullin 3